MLEQLLRVPLSWWGISPSQQKRPGAVFFFTFFIAGAYYLVKPAGRSFVLESIGAAHVPFADLAGFFFVLPLAWGVLNLSRRFSPIRATTGVLIFCASMMLFCLWALLSGTVPFAAVITYVWLNGFSVLSLLAVWLIARKLYNPGQLRSNFGFIGAGGILGALAGAYSSAIVAHRFGSETLLLFSAAVLLAAGLAARRLNSRLDAKTSESSSLPGMLGVFKRSRYVVQVTGLLCFAQFISTLIYYQSNFFIDRLVSGVDAKTAFIGVLLGTSSAFALIIQIALAGFVMRRRGGPAAMRFWPAAMGVFCGLLLFGSAFFGLIVFMEVFDRALTHSMVRSGKETLYLPLRKEARDALRTAGDLLAPQLGMAAAALAAVLVLYPVSQSESFFAAVTIVLLLGWFWLALRVHVNYARSVRLILQANSMADEREPHPLPRLKAWIRPQRTAAPVALAQPLCSESKLLLLLEGIKPYRESVYANAFMAELIKKECVHPKDKVEADRLLRVAHKLESCRLTEALDASALGGFSVNGTRGSLLVLMREHPDNQVRYAAVHRLLRARIEESAALLPREALERQLQKDAEMCALLMRLKQLCRHCCAGQGWLLQLIDELNMDSVRNVFRALMLRYRTEELHLIYHQLSEPNPAARADALGKLNNLIDRRLLRPVERVVGDFYDPPVQAFYEHSSDIEMELRALIEHPNYWLSLVGMMFCLYVGTKPLAEDLQRLQSRNVPVLSKAAQFVVEANEHSPFEEVLC